MAAHGGTLIGYTLTRPHLFGANSFSLTLLVEVASSSSVGHSCHWLAFKIRQLCFEQLALRGCHSCFSDNTESAIHSLDTLVRELQLYNYMWSIKILKWFDHFKCFFLTVFLRRYISTCYDIFSQCVGGETLLTQSCPNLCVYFYTAVAVRALSWKEFPLAFPLCRCLCISLCECRRDGRIRAKDWSAIPWSRARR